MLFAQDNIKISVFEKKIVKSKSVAAQQEFCGTASAINLFFPQPAQSCPSSPRFAGTQNTLA